MKTLLMDGQKVALTEQEHQVFAALFNARGAVVSMADLTFSMNTAADDAENVARQRIWAIRKKLEPTDFRIISHMKVGYWLSRLPEVVIVEKAA